MHRWPTFLHNSKSLYLTSPYQPHPALQNYHNMNRGGRSIQVIANDLNRIQLSISRTNIQQLPIPQARLLLNQLYGIKRRALNCRFITSTRSRSTRALILRRAFQSWRTIVRQMVHTAHLRAWIVDHLQTIGSATSIFDLNNWVIRLTTLEPRLFIQVLPEVLTGAPLSAQTLATDPYWRAVKLNLSPSRL